MPCFVTLHYHDTGNPFESNMDYISGIIRLDSKPDIYEAKTRLYPANGMKPVDVRETPETIRELIRTERRGESKISTRDMEKIDAPRILGLPDFITKPTK